MTQKTKLVDLEWPLYHFIILKVVVILQKVVVRYRVVLNIRLPPYTAFSFVSKEVTIFSGVRLLMQ